MGSKVAVITARGGSKRIPRKNIRPFCGRPMIEYVIETAQQSGLFHRILVSTDDEEIATVSRDAGAEVPFLRPAELANDTAGTLVVMEHAVNWLVENEFDCELVCCLFPTSPFLEPEYLARGAIALEEDPAAKFSFAVTTYASPVFRSFSVDSEGDVSMFWPENETKRSQELPEAFHDAGMFYWGRPDAFRFEERIYSARCKAVVMPRHLVHDLDTAEDWERAELCYRAWRGVTVS